MDELTGLVWFRNANIAEFPLTWQEALDHVAHMNRDQAAGYADWGLPNRRELRSLISHQSRRPSLPAAHPFMALQDVYWSSSSSLFEPDWAWALYLNKGAVGVGQKARAHFHVWAVHD